MSHTFGASTSANPSLRMGFLSPLPAGSSPVWCFASHKGTLSRYSLKVSRGALAGATPSHLPVPSVARPLRPITISSATEFPELIRRHLGTWQGTYHIIDPRSGGTIDRHRCKIEVGIRGERYAQRNTYTWDDGRQQVYEFAGRMVDGVLRIESDRLEGRCYLMGNNALSFVADMKGKEMTVVDCILLLTEDTRARTWQISEGDQVTKIVHVEESRTSRDDTYFDVASDPWAH